MGLWLSALNAIYRDVRYVVPFLVQFWMFASPVVYPAAWCPKVALALRAQPHGRRHRRLPLGAHRTRPAARLDLMAVSFSVAAILFCQRPYLLPHDWKRTIADVV